MRAAYDAEQAAVSRLRAAADLASGHGSVPLLRRCEEDLVRGAPAPRAAFCRPPERTRVPNAPRTPPP